MISPPFCWAHIWAQVKWCMEMDLNPETPYLKQATMLIAGTETLLSKSVRSIHEFLGRNVPICTFEGIRSS